MLNSMKLNALNVTKITQEEYVGDFMNGFVTLVERIANPTC